MRFFKSRGFTLIELLIVISIIGILAGVVVTVLNPNHFRAKARDSVRKEDLAVIQGALERYYADNNSYPNALSSLNSGSTKYIKVLPKDPKNNTDYGYEKRDSGQSYCLCANLENPDSSSVSDTCGSPPNNNYNHCVYNPF